MIYFNSIALGSDIGDIFEAPHLIVRQSDLRRPSARLYVMVNQVRDTGKSVIRRATATWSVVAASG